MTQYIVIGSSSMVNGQAEDIGPVLSNFQQIATIVNGELDDGNVAAAAGIQISKLQGYPSDNTLWLRGDGTWQLLGAVNALPADTVIPAATRIISNKLTAADTQPAWKVRGDGRMDWGPGGTSAPDTDLYRSAAGILKTDSVFQSAQWISPGTYLQAQTYVYVDYGNTGSKLYFGSAADAYLYRRQSRQLGSNSGLFIALPSGAAGFGLAVDGDSQNRFLVDCNGGIQWGNGSTLDSYLNRPFANALMTNSWLILSTATDATST